MKKLLASTVLALAFLSGCAGTNFKRPEANALQVGVSTQADVVRVMGTPMQTGEVLKNNQKIKSTRYAYAEGAGAGRYPGVVPARAMVFSTFNELLVGQEFVSSFPQDATEFDESKVPQVVKGKTTRADVHGIFGKPNGEVVYPIIKNAGERADVYSYSHAKGSVFDMKFYSKALIVSYDPSGIVSDVEFSSAGEK